jgi:hypothetical protein
MYAARTLADSISPAGIRLTTLEAIFPRMILAEMNTHRVLSRNSASSRAIPPETHIDRIREHPFVPAAFHQRVKGMGQGAALNEREQQAARAVWENAAEYAARYAEQLMGMDVSKAHVNRILEPFMWHTAIISSTDWDNFYALRCPPGDEVDYDFPAQPEFQQVAILMRKAMRESAPAPIGYDQWHLPLVNLLEMKEDHDTLGDPLYWPMVSAGRTARVSFDTQDNYEEPDASYDRAVRLKSNGHLSPMEHCATPAKHYPADTGNFRGWKQLRKHIMGEDNLVGRLEGRLHWDAD